MLAFKKRFSATVLALLTVAAGLIANPAPSSASDVTVTSVVTLRNRFSGMCLDVPGGTTENKKAVQQYYCNGGANQKWEYLPGQYPGYGKFRNLASQMCLDVRDTSMSVGAVIQQYHCIDVPNQQWTYPGSDGYVRALHSGLCFGVQTNQYKAPVYQAVCGGGSVLIFTQWDASPF